MITFPLYPMLLNKSDLVPKGSEYIHQLKIDGIRAIMHYSPTGLKLSTRHLTDMTPQFPEITSLKLNARDAILDGELCCLDEENSSKPSFEKTMQRFLASRQKIQSYTKTLPATFFAFDILQLNGQPLINRKLTERLEILKGVIQPSDHLVMLESYEDGEALYKATKNMGLEGIVSKQKNSRYFINKRDEAWIKVKNYVYDIVNVVSIRKGDFGWGLAENGKYLGITELVSAEARKALWHVGKQIIENEDKKFIYLKPYISIKVKSIGRTSNGYLRTPSFIEFVFDEAN